VELNVLGREAGCRAVRLTEAGKKVFGREALVLPQSHGDVVTRLPPGAELWGESDFGVQMFRLKRAVCIQGHPEFFPEHTRSCLERLGSEEQRREAEATVALHGRGDGRAVGETIARLLLFEH
jgi:GMP synthase-like glutamine amidotransferase